MPSKNPKKPSKAKEAEGRKKDEPRRSSKDNKSRDKPESKSSTKERSRHPTVEEDQRRSDSRRMRSRSRHRSRREHSRRRRRSEGARSIVSRSKHDSRANRESRGRRPRSRDHRQTRSPDRPRRTESRIPRDPDYTWRSTSRRRRERTREPEYRHKMTGAGEFEQAMKAIATNAEARTKGVFTGISGGEDNFKEQFAQALALKLNFKTSQQANEKALRQLMDNKGSAYGVKQALQARAAIYDNMLDPSWFVKNFDLSAKTKDVGQRREARAMLIGAVLLIAQLGAHDIRSRLSQGTPGLLKEILYDPRRGTALQFIKLLSQAPMLEVMEVICKEKKDVISEKLLQHADDLDYLQNLISSIGRETSINPSMNAVAEAFARRRYTGRFKTTGQSVRLDTMLYRSTKGTTDEDESAVTAGK